MKIHLRTVLCTFCLAVLASCGGGGGLAAEAQDHSEQTCACEGFDCTMEHIQWFNKQRVVNDEEIQALGEADRVSFDAAEVAAALCQNDLR